jgi:hypothetical protein
MKDLHCIELLLWEFHHTIHFTKGTFPKLGEWFEESWTDDLLFLTTFSLLLLSLILKFYNFNELLHSLLNCIFSLGCSSLRSTLCRFFGQFSSILLDQLLKLNVLNQSFRTLVLLLQELVNLIVLIHHFLDSCLSICRSHISSKHHSSIPTACVSQIKTQILRVLLKHFPCLIVECDLKRSHISIVDYVHINILLLEKSFYYLIVALRGCVVKRCAVVHVLKVNLSSSFKKKADAFSVTSETGDVKRGSFI